MLLNMQAHKHPLQHRVHEVVVCVLMSMVLKFNLTEFNFWSRSSLLGEQQRCENLNEESCCMKNRQLIAVWVVCYKLQLLRMDELCRVLECLDKNRIALYLSCLLLHYLLPCPSPTYCTSNLPLIHDLTLRWLTV